MTIDQVHIMGFFFSQFVIKKSIPMNICLKGILLSFKKSKNIHEYSHIFKT